MKLLFDENLSFRLVVSLADIFPGSLHVRDVGLLGAADRRIWEFAAEQGFILVSKDTDFYDRSVLYGVPPKVIWLRTGNSTVMETADVLRNKYMLIRHFMEDIDSSFLPVHA